MTNDPNASDPLEALAAAGTARKTAAQTAQADSPQKLRLPSMPAWKALTWPIAAYSLGSIPGLAILLARPGESLYGGSDILCLLIPVACVLFVVGALVNLFFLMYARPLSRRGYSIKGYTLAWVGFGMSVFPAVVAGAWGMLLKWGLAGQ